MNDLQLTEDHLNKEVTVTIGNTKYPGRLTAYDNENKTAMVNYYLNDTEWPAQRTKYEVLQVTDHEPTRDTEKSQDESQE